MNKLINDYLQVAIQIGIDPLSFYDYTPEEINILVEEFKEKQKREAVMVWRLADLIGASVSRLMSKEGKYPSIYEAFPELFEKSKEMIMNEEKAQLKAFFANISRRNNNG